jgi:hypothetical protein
VWKIKMNFKKIYKLEKGKKYFHKKSRSISIMKDDYEVPEKIYKEYEEIPWKYRY